MEQISGDQIPSPCFVLEEKKLRKNLNLIRQVSEKAGVEIILAFKGFSMFSAFPIVKEYIDGATASSINELRLCNEEMKTLAHAYFVAYSKQDFDEVLSGSSHITFNSLSQAETFKEEITANKEKVKFGLRVNPEYSEVTTALYNPASSTSRLGVTIGQMPEELPDGISGLHFHVLCESDSFALENTLSELENKFGKYLSKISWLNLGGGHLMTREGYDIEHLIQVLRDFRKKHKVAITLEPGSAFAWQTGNLITSVIDVVENGGVKTVIIDASFTCHMPDCLEMPYRPVISEASDDENGLYRYNIGGLSCLAGDFIPDYYFSKELQIGDTLTFEDMMHYTMVKTTTFNGVPHPSIGILNEQGSFTLIRSFNYEDFKGRLS
ncbi:MAG: carboxynorspermidine decarboxylase [Cyclobacteriaceae bacterium]